MSKNKTVGAESVALMMKNHVPVSVIDYEREMHKNYEDEIFKCVEANTSKYKGNFYIVVLRKRERLLPNVYRNFFLARKSCPTPTYDQIVYKYHRQEEIVEFLWVVPDNETCVVFVQDALRIDPAERELLGFILDYNDGTLDNLCKKLNNEE